MKLILFLEAFRIFQIDFYNEPLPFLPPPFSGPHTDDKHNKQQVRAFIPSQEEKYSRQLEELKLYPTVWLGSNFHLL